MRFSVILIILFLFPVFLIGQSDVIFYSEAPMYVKYKEGETKKGESSSTTLYIGGSAKFATGSLIEQKGRTEIIKDFINAKDPLKDTGVGSNLFVNKNETTSFADGVVAFVDKEVNAPSTLQRIYGVIPDGSTAKIDQQKTVNWIDFPSISVEKGKPLDGEDWRKVGYLMVDVTGSLSVDYVNAKRGDRFAVNMKYDQDNSSTTINSRLIKSGYARIKDITADTDVPTYSQVNLSLYHYDKTKNEDDGAFIDDAQGRPIADPDTYSDGNGTLRKNDGWNYLTGFTPPFASLGADYMFYHALTAPNHASITSNKGPIVDPYRRLDKGVGYFMSMEVSHNDHPFIDERWDYGDGNSILAENRARGGYVFNRMVFHDYLSKPGGEMNNFSRFYYDEDGHSTIHGVSRPIGGIGGKWMEEGKDRSRYEEMLDETFNTANTEVVVSLKPGLNFLGNPFMVPISLNPLLGYDVHTKEKVVADMENEAVAIAAFKPTTGREVKVSSHKMLDADLRAKYWLINEALIKYDEGADLFRFKAKYDYISRNAGATLAVGNGDTGNGGEVDPNGGVGGVGPGAPANLNGIEPLEYLIAPMQMFCLQAAQEVDIKLDMNALSTFGKTHFLKSTKASADNDIMKDWFVVEVNNEADHSTDRMSVVFNDAAKPYFANDPYDTSKGISDKFEEFVPEYEGEKTKTRYEGSTGIIYTKSTEGKQLLGNAIPSDIKELGLFFMPPSSTQELTLKFYGIDNLESVPGVWLIDRLLDKKVRIYPGDEYKFVSDVSTTKTYNADNNRFVLRFYDEESDDIITDDEKDIFCYYQGSSVYVTNLNEGDINSDIQVYDLQGRLILKDKIDSEFTDYFVKPLSLGTYIVKITGKRNHTSKIVNTGK